MSDLINRQDAIEYFMTNTNWHDEDGYTIENADEKRALLTDYFNGVPSAEPERKKGHWIEQGLIPYEGIRRRCSVCEKVYATYEPFDFCPNCGAEMQNAKQELVKESDGLVKDLVKPMSPEEAVDLLDNLLGMMEDSQGNDYDKALYMGIEAIKRGQWKGGNDEDG